MSVIYCPYCHEHIDTDFNAEHFTYDLTKCVKEIEDDK